MDISMLAPELAKLLGVQPSTLVLLIFALNVASRAITRAIPDNATGWQGFVRRLTAILAVEVSSRIAPGVTVKDVARAAADTQPITQKVAEATDTPEKS